ncbi:hypothetical protein [Moraxella bovoculi]|uniref:hypothetical protein n=1 Tax=Moraxella bovoculi TaxID=386891 RepID=UPI00072F5A6F|nr:hypothetical protein [Moraxella bovoculi]ALT07503.1 hypothetical protein AAX08_05675 [Moraxella bovoculi]
MMMYLLSISDNKETIICVANLCFFMGKAAQFVVLFDALTALSTQVWTQIGIITALAFVFMALGARINRYLPVRVFRQIILWILVLLGLRLGYFGVMGVLA